MKSKKREIKQLLSATDAFIEAVDKLSDHACAKTPNGEFYGYKPLEREEYLEALAQMNESKARLGELLR